MKLYSLFLIKFIFFFLFTSCAYFDEEEDKILPGKRERVFISDDKILKKANKHGLTDGKLLQDYKKKGEVYTGFSAASEASLDARIENASNRISKDDSKFVVKGKDGVRLRV